MPTTRILLIRHADSHHKTDAVHGGPRTCRGLTDHGRDQTTRLRDRLTREGHHPAAVYASTIPRALETARLLQAGPVTPDCGLCTYHLPDWADGLTWQQINDQAARPDGGLYHPFQQGNESWADLVLRAAKTLTAIAARHTGTTTLVVTHAEIVEASLIAYAGLPIHRGFDIKTTNASITEWTTQDDPAAPWHPESDPNLPVRWTLTRLNDAAHLA